MKRIWTVCLIAVLSLAGAALSQSQSTAGTEKAIAALEQQWLESQKSNNSELVAPLLAEKFINTNSESKTSPPHQPAAHDVAALFVRASAQALRERSGCFDGRADRACIWQHADRIVT